MRSGGAHGALHAAVFRRTAVRAAAGAVCRPAAGATASAFRLRTRPDQRDQGVYRSRHQRPGLSADRAGIRHE